MGIFYEKYGVFCKFSDGNGLCGVFLKYDVWNEYLIMFEIKNYDLFFVVIIVSLWFLCYVEVVCVIWCYEIGS